MNEKYDKIRILYDKGSLDIKASETLANERDGEFYSSIICFHSQQAIEKYLKAFLMYNEASIPKTHDLLRLAAFCSDFNTVFAEFELEGFASYGVDIRYDDPQPTFDEAKNSIVVAKKVMDYVVKQIPMEESKG